MPKVNQILTRLMKSNLVMLSFFIFVSMAICFVFRYEVIADINNYHYYIAWAFFNGRTFQDIAVGVENSYLNPLIEIPAYLLIEHFNDTPIVYQLYHSLYWGMLAFVAYLLVKANFSVDTVKGKIQIFMTMLFILTGFGFLVQNGTSSNEIPVILCVMVGLYLIYKELFILKQERWQIFAFSGVLMGAALGLKLTIIVWCLALGLTLICFWKKLKTPFILLATAHISHLLFKDEDIAGIISKIKKKKLSAKLAAYKNYLSSFAYLQEGDMLSASENASAALKFFQKKRYFFEEAQSYLLLAEIYRVSCVNDVAQTMIESALKIFESAKLQFFKAQTIAVLGMLMLFENRIDEACDKLTLAKNISFSDELTADISNQIALVCLAQKNEKNALKHSKQALTLYLRQHNERGEAFSRQLIGHFLLNGGKTSQAFNSAKKAADLYLGQQNFSAYAETLYLQARALCQLEKYDQAEKKLRLILSENRKHSLNFHVAHAYSLLALIFLRKKNLQRAKVLLQQSLMLEQNHERCSGLASDYANLALIEKLSGNFEAAKNNLKQALEYAKESGDENLLQLIKEQKNNI